jgi:uncharacterized paraquat-inducible protein A
MLRTKLFPELLLLDSNAEQKELLREARRKMRHRGWYAAAVSVGVVGSVLVPRYFEHRIGIYLSLVWTRLLGILASGLALAAVVWAILSLWHNPLRDQIRLELIRRGIPVCLGCGYNLTGNTSGVCPECGQPFEPKADSQ